jgi:protease I
MVIAQKSFRDEELLTPKKAFESAGHSVTVVAPSTATATGMLGAKVTPDGTIKDAESAKYDAVVFVGGSGATALFDDRDAHRLAREAVEGGKVVGAICLAPSILARAGLLKGKRATVWKSESKTLESGGATYTGEPVTVDGKLVTGNGPEAAAEFADELLKQLK